MIAQIKDIRIIYFNSGVTTVHQPIPERSGFYTWKNSK
jgi:hypothetical protein